MDQPVRLVPLVCPNCSTRILAQPGEVAWVCSQCRQGWLLTEQASLTSLEVNYSAAIPANQPGKPYWVTRGKVDLTRQGVNRKDGDFAVAWAKTYGKGRVLYNGLGHTTEVWERPDFQRMWMEMVLWTLGLRPGNTSARPKAVN